MIRKFLTSVAVAGLAAGAANAVGLENGEAVPVPSEPYPVADSLDYAMGVVETVNVGFGPSAGSFPTGNVLVFVDVTGGTFTAPLDGTEVGGTTTSVISSGGLKGGSSVTFLISGADMCAADTTAGADTTCSLNLPLALDGSDVTVSVGLETDAGAPVDNTDQSTKVTATIIDTLPAFQVAVTADMVATTADLNATNGPFEDLLGAPADAVIGTILAGANTVSYAMGPARTVNVDFGDTDVSAAQAGAITFTLTGEQDAFSTDAMLGTTGNITVDAGAAITPNATTDVAAGTLVFGALTTVTLVPDTMVAIARSGYDVEVTIPVAAPPVGVTTGLVGSGALQSVDRNGTTIVFPWTQTSTLGAASGTTSVYRIGNLGSVATGAIFAEVKNASEAGYMNPGIVQIGASIAADGELVATSSTLETALGNYGRGDIEFTAEADPDTLTGRQFVVRGDVIQQVQGGTIQEDLQ